jgi:hypothetical protein
MTSLAADTPWIELLLSEETALDRLISYDPKVAKFRRVLNDERVATELRTVDVARMINLPLEILLAVVKGHPDGVVANISPEQLNDSAWAEAATERVPLDLRPVFADGHEPLTLILEQIGRLPDSAALVIDAPFHPMPLRRMLGGRGYLSAASQLAPDHWQVAFRHAPAA